MLIKFCMNKIEPEQIASADLPAVPNIKDWVIFRHAGVEGATPYAVVNVEWNITKHTTAVEGGQVDVAVYLEAVR